MIPNYKIADWITCKQNFYMRRCDFIRTMVLNTMFGFLYLYKLRNMNEEELLNAIENCVKNIDSYDAYEDSDIIRKIVKDELNVIFFQKEA